MLQKRLRELAFLNSGVRIIFKDERTGESEEFHYERGLVEFIEYLNRASEAVHQDVIYLKTEAEGVQIEVALQYANEYTENLHSYVNNIHTPDGGTHVIGFRTALTRTLNNYGKKEELFKDLVPSGEDFREGLTAIVAVRVAEPQFQAQTKNRLNNPEVEGIVNTAFGEFLGKYLEENPKTAKTIIKKGLLAAEAREAARKAKEVLRNRKGVLGSGSLPGKLRDCLSQQHGRVRAVPGRRRFGRRHRPKGGRLRQFQAILPLRGKIINAYKSREDKVLDNAEIQAMIQAIGTGIGADQDITKLRYNKIIIMTDADVDGSHIRTLLLCFFYRQMYQLVATGARLCRPAAAVSRDQGQGQALLRADRRGDAGPAHGAGRHRLRAGPGGRPGTSPARRCSGWPRILAGMEEALLALERRGISLKSHAERQDRRPASCPCSTSSSAARSTGSPTGAELDKFLEEQEAAGGEISDQRYADGHVDRHTSPKRERGPPPAACRPATASRPRPRSSTSPSCTRSARSTRAWPTCKSEFGFDLDMLIPQERTGSDQPRYVLRRGEHEVALEDLRGLAAAVREMGQKGLHVTRFKGLGEMNAEELRETTLDPANRTLVQSQDGRRRRRRRHVPRPHGRQSRTPPRIHRKARPGSAQSGCVAEIAAGLWGRRRHAEGGGEEGVDVGGGVDQLGGRRAGAVAGAGFDADQHGLVAGLRRLQRGGELEAVGRHHAVVVVAGGDQRGRIFARRASGCAAANRRAAS